MNIKSLRYYIDNNLEDEGIKEIYKKRILMKEQSIDKLNELEIYATKKQRHRMACVIYKMMILTNEDERKLADEIYFTDTSLDGNTYHLAAKHNNMYLFYKANEYKENINLFDSDGKPPIYYSIKNGYTKMVKSFINHRANINKRIDECGTLLNYAVSLDNIEIAELLLIYGVDVNEQFGYSSTVLFTAVEQNNIEMVKMLFKYGVNLNSVDYFNNIALKYAIDKGFTEMAKLLIDHNSNLLYTSYLSIPYKPINRNLSLFQYISLVSLDLVKYLINKGYRFDLSFLISDFEYIYQNPVYYYQKKCLQYYICNNRLDIAKNFVNEEVVNFEYDSKTILQIAKEHNDIDLIMLLEKLGAKETYTNKICILIEYCGDLDVMHSALLLGADINQMDKFNRTPMHASIRVENPFDNFNVQLTDFLIKNNIDLNAIDENDKSALDYLFEEGKIEYASMLLLYGAEIPNRYGESYLFEMVRLNKYNEIKKYDFMYEYDEYDNLEDSLLIIALKYKHTRLAIYIINRGANIDKCNKAGKCALYYAIIYGMTMVVEALINKDVFTDIDINGISILDYALYNNMTGIAVLLINTGNSITKNSLFIATKQNNYRAVNALTKRGIDLNAIDTEGNTAMHYSALDNNSNIFYHLESNYGDVHIKNHNNKSAHELLNFL